MKASDFQPLFMLNRCGHAESLHYGAIAVVDPVGRLIASIWKPENYIFPRSSAKVYQAMPLLEAGGIEAFGLSDEELALICASHSGTDDHVRAVRQLQTKIGMEEKNLLCGANIPYHRETAERMLKKGERPTTLRHNCLGKHSAMLALAKLKSWDLKDYVNLNHPVQIDIQKSFSEWTDIAVENLAVGVDGCSAPNFAVPLRATAFAYARLMDPRDMSENKRIIAEQLSNAMRAHPGMVSGPGRFDTALMEATNGRLLSKEGAEGFQAIGIPSGANGKKAPSYGIAIKIADGDARGWVAGAVALEVLRQLGALSSKELEVLKEFGPQRSIVNQSGIQVGEAQADFELERA